MVKILKIFLLLFIFSSLPSKVLILKWRDTDFYNEAIEGFKEVITTSYEVYSCNGKTEEVSKILSRSDEYDVIVLIGEGALKGGINMNIKKNIVFAMVYNPEIIVKGKENITGVSLNISSKTQFQTIKRIFPEIKKIGILYSNEILIKDIDKISSTYGFNLKKIKINNENEISSALLSLKNCELILIIPDPILSSYLISSILVFSIENRIPVFAPSDKIVEAGAVIGLVPNYRENGKKAAKLVNEIIKSKTIPPIEEMESGKLYLNEKVAKEIGITFPDDIIKEAVKIFK